MTKSQSTTPSDRAEYWGIAIRFYAKAAFAQSAVVWAPGLVLPPLLFVLRLRQASLRAVLAAMAFGIGIGAVFFLGMFATAVGHDIKRNRGQSDPTVEWNPLLFWKVFLYAGSLMMLTCAFASYRQGWWFSVEFGGFAVVCWFVAGWLSVSVSLPKSRPHLNDPAQVDHARRHKHWGGGHLHPGFVAMEYFALMLNRSFLVFITEEGLRCWRFQGVVSSLEPRFYEPVEALLDDPDMTPGSEAFEELMRRRHTFCLPYSSISSVQLVNRPKWGMGPVPHTGRLRIRFHGHRREREFILLGPAHGQVIRDLIASKIKIP